MQTIKPPKEPAGPQLSAEQEAALRIVRDGGVFGGPQGNKVARPPGEALAEREGPPGGAEPLWPDDDLLRYKRLFLGRARARGAPGMPKLASTLRAAATVPGPNSGPPECLDEQGFTRVAIAEGLCLCVHECGRLFRELAAPFGGHALPVSALIDHIYGELAEHRLRMVQEVWRSLDQEEAGQVEVRHLLAMFDATRLPAVRFGGEDRLLARRHLLEGLGVSDNATGDGPRAFALEEAGAGRRPWPSGAAASGTALGGGPLHAPAGKPRSRVRDRGDVQAEMRSRPPAHRGDELVTERDFVAYYTSLSHGLDDDEFEHVVKDPWQGHLERQEAEAARVELRAPNRGERKAKLRVLATMEDGSQRVLVIHNDKGLRDHLACAGSDNGQIWTWGSGCEEEVIRRFKAEGVHGVRRIRLTPF